MLNFALYLLGRANTALLRKRSLSMVVRERIFCTMQMQRLVGCLRRHSRLCLDTTEVGFQAIPNMEISLEVSCAKRPAE